jgi:23S rRNA (adenine2503-C2)-methyltransferase
MSVKPQGRESIYSLTLEQLREALVEAGLARFAADQVYHWIYKRFVFDPDQWSNVSSKVKDLLTSSYSFALPKIVWSGQSVDGTRKFLVAMEDQKTVETVAIPAKNDRLTLCISSQVGCAIGCKFCHTGTMGLTRHLSAGEIVGQFMAISRWLKDRVSDDERLTNIVYMGQGEPLHNFDNVKRATMIFLEDKGLGLGQRKITLSTSGLVPQIEKLGDFPPVNIAISLHAAHNNIRSELMPINKVYDLERLLLAISKIPLKAHRWITYEYLLIEEMNDREEDVEALAQLLNPAVSKINLIPFNEYPESAFKRPSETRIKWFQKSLMKKGFITTVRTTMGTDILAACGQLKSKADALNLWDDMAKA